jgi:hypothetical protein
MGCVQKRNRIKVNYKLSKNKFFPYSLSIGEKYSTINEDYKDLRKNKTQRITSKFWVMILNYLDYNELKETGKVNKFFNNTVKQKEILVKFFKKRDTDSKYSICKKIYQNNNSYLIINSFVSFSVLQNNNFNSEDVSPKNNDLNNK